VGDSCECYPGDEITWEKTYGGDSVEMAAGLDRTYDGGFILAGTRGSYPPQNDHVLLMKLGSCGNALWARTYPMVSWDVKAGDVHETTDSGFIIAGSINPWPFKDPEIDGCPRALLMKTDSVGNKEWHTTYPGSDCEDIDWYGGPVQQTIDGGYILAGTRGSPPEKDIFAVKTDALGTIIWHHIYGKEDCSEMPHSVIQSSDGGYVITGTVITPAQPAYENDIIVVKIDDDGDTVWTKTYGDSGTIELGGPIVQTPDGGYLIAGLKEWDICLIRTDDFGNTIWTKTYENPDFNENVSSMELTSDSGYVLAGSIGSGSLYDFYVLKVDSLGDSLWSREIGSDTDSEDAFGVRQASDGGYVVAGQVNYLASGENYDVYVVKIPPDSLMGCCVGIRSDVNMSGTINVGDQTYLSAYLKQKPPGSPEPPCFEEGDVNGSGTINTGDITYLTAYLKQKPPGSPAPPPCP
jgi:hypothetical protein